MIRDRTFTNLFEKILFLNIILVLLHQLSFSQTFKDAKKGDYIRSSNIDKFIGTWEWKSGNDRFVVTFKKQKIKSPQYSFDALLGWYQYIKDGETIYSYLAKVSDKDTYVTGSATRHDDATLVGISNQDSEGILLNFYDEKRQKYAKAWIKMLPGKSNELVWQSKSGTADMVTTDGQKPIVQGKKLILRPKPSSLDTVNALPIPVTWVLKKVN